MSAGNFITSQQRRTVRIIGEIDQPYDLGDFVIKSENGNPIYLKDVAEIFFKDKDKTTYARESGAPVVMLDVKKRSGENMVAAADKIGVIVQNAKADIFPKQRRIEAAADIIVENRGTTPISRFLIAWPQHAKTSNVELDGGSIRDRRMNVFKQV